MPKPHEQAAIDAATGRRRERLVKAAALLDRIRAEHPGVENIPDLPAELRPAVRDASRAFRFDSRFSFGVAVLLLFLAISIGAAYLKPVRLFRCEPQGEGQARCLVADRVFGLFPRPDRPDRVVAGITRTVCHTRLTSAESRETHGRITKVESEEEELELFDASDQKLWSSTEDHLLGASLTQVGHEIDAILSGATRQPLLRVQAFWPVLLLGGLFTLAFFNAAFRHLGVALRDRELIPARLYEVVFGWGGLLIPLFVCGFACLVVFMGKDPPASIAPLLGLR